MITAMAMAMLLAQAGGGGGGSRPAATPVGSPAAWFGPDDYPVDALRSGEEGRVAFLVDVDVSGAPTGCHIVTSSGSSALDNGTCAIILKKGQFKPAHGDSGKPVAGQWSSATHWQLDGTPPPIDLTAGLTSFPAFRSSSTSIRKVKRPNAEPSRQFPAKSSVRIPAPPISREEASSGPCGRTANRCRAL